MSNLTRYLFLIVFFVLYLTSLFLPGVVFTAGPPLYGWDILTLEISKSLAQGVLYHHYILGVFLAILSIPLTLSAMPTDLGSLAWYSNVIAIWVLISSTKFSRAGYEWKVSIAAFAAPFVGLRAFLFVSPPNPEGPMPPAVLHLGIGYYIWELSLLFLLVYWLMYLRMKQKREPRIAG